MTKDHRLLWEAAANATDKTQAAKILAESLVDKEGRDFILRLGSEDAESCIKILDNVSRHLYSPHSPPPQTVSSGYCRAQPQTRREAGFLGHVEETCRASRTTAHARSRENNGGS